MLKLDGDSVEQFVEKPVEEGSWMNSGYYVMEPGFIDYIPNDESILEKVPMETLVQNGQLAAFKHNGFFRGMDSMRDRIELEALWNSQQAPWKVWRDDYENMKLSDFWGRSHWNLERPA